MNWETSLQYASQSDVGFRRANNEDACRVHVQRDADAFERHGHVFVVADGMGGHAVGELASKLAVETVPLAFSKSNGQPLEAALRSAIEEANRVIHQKGTTNPEFANMGTTCSVLVLAERGAYVGHVGDSRVYRVRADRIDQLTFDHSLKWELERHARVNPSETFAAETSHVITRSLGPNADVEVDVDGPIPIAEGDAYVLCSDGLTGHVADDEIGAIVGYLKPAEACRMLVNLALLRGGADNVTVVVVRAGDASASRRRARPGDDTAVETPVLSLGGRGAAMAGFVAAVLFAAGIGTALQGAWDVGSALAVGGVALAVWALLQSWRRREIRTAESPPGVAETIVWRPHATASGHLTLVFLERLAAAERELREQAEREQWPIDGPAHERASAKAAASVREREFPRALKAFARSFDVLMEGVHQLRRQRQREAKWGPSTTRESTAES